MRKGENKKKRALRLQKGGERRDVRHKLKIVWRWGEAKEMKGN